MKRLHILLALALTALLAAGALYALNAERAADVTAAPSLELPLETSIGGGPLDRCPRDILCPDVYDPVTCSNGVTYPNSCYAFAACATGCGGSGV